MVKADPKRDYYADLDLTPTADTELIKKRFRELAKQYHPDRNPGREVDVVPRFQAVQAANEILSDPNQKAKYDAERAKLNKPVTSPDPPMFKRPPPPPQNKTQTGFNNPPPQARRDPSAKGTYRTAPSARPTSAASANSADRFTTFARNPPPQPQTWDRQRFEESRAEALRGMNAMKGGQAGAPPPPPQAPPRPNRHPTAPKTNLPSDGPPYSAGAGPSPGFPGLGRTASHRKVFSAATERPDRPDRPDRSDRPDRPERPPSTGPYPNSPQQHHMRHTKSSGYDGFEQVRPGLGRTSSRYAGHGGERTNINTTNLPRSASVRNSPIDSRYEERGPFAASKPTQGQQNENRPRHRSASPKIRPEGGVRFQFSTSDTSSEEAAPSGNAERPKATPKSNAKRPAGPFMANRTMSGDEPALTGQFPNTNYTRVVDDNSYAYPPPESKGNPSRRPFSNVTSPVDAFPYQYNGSTNSGNSGDVPDSEQRQFNGSAISEENQSPKTTQSGFSATEWQEKFKNGDGFFTPPDVDSKDRRSPTRGNRNARQAGRNASSSRSQEDLPDDTDPITSGTKHVSPEEARAKAAAFQEGKFSAEDWAERLKSQNDLSGTKAKPSHRTSKSGPSRKPADANEDQSGTNETESANEANAGVDEMDVDDPTENAIPSKFDTNGATQTQPPNGNHRSSRSSNAGVDLNDLGRTAPFGPSGSGLRDMDDLNTSLPFDSKAARNVNLGRTNSQTLRDLNLPRPPRPIEPPPDYNITQESWKNYTDSMNSYMHDWNIFNSKMIEHFRQRQEQVTNNMYHNWISAQGDGASADDFDRSHGHNKAGYATYMQWLEDDHMCRTWWDTACSEHRKCLENLGRTRQTVKSKRG